MKSGKQRRLEIKEKRRQKALRNQAVYVYSNNTIIPENAIKSDPNELLSNSIFDIFPRYYLDKAFVCVDCGSDEIWTAKQQKWWYEIRKGHIDSIAKRCRRCRRVIREAKAEQKAHMEVMAEKAPHPNEAFFKRK